MVEVTDSTTTKIDFLRSLGCMEKGHSGRDLYTHLEGTRKILEELGTPEYLQDAGLFHSIYGTASFMPDGGMISFEKRDEVRKLIGEKAEEIVYWFCIIDKPRRTNIEKLEEGQLKNDLVWLNYANQIEQEDAKKEESRLDFYNDGEIK
jgi:hypothetical protein